MRSTAFLLLAAVVEAKHGSYHGSEALHKRHHHHHERDVTGNQTLETRAGTCAFPTGLGLVAVSPGGMNGGWAFAPDQTCYPGRWCPYACPSGEVSMQWDPSVTSYVYPGSRNGGLLCNPDGSVSKGFPNKPYCQATANNIGVKNNAGAALSFCQTVLPGDEDMLIPTIVSSWSALAMPDPSYWAESASHFYINAPGVGAEGCIWGTNANPIGNWAPYVAGGNSNAAGQTFIKLGWNPVYLENATPFRNVMPNWGVKIECPNGGCSGLPCSIDPSVNSVNQMTGPGIFVGAGGATGCVVGVSPGATANFVVFSQSGSGSAAQSSPSSSSSSSVQSTTTSSSIASSTTSSSLSSTSTSANSTISSSSFNSTTTGRPSPAAYYLVSNATTAVAANAVTQSASAVAAETHSTSHSGSAALQIPSMLALSILLFLL